MAILGTPLVAVPSVAEGMVGGEFSGVISRTGRPIVLVGCGWQRCNKIKAVIKGK